MKEEKPVWMENEEAEMQTRNKRIKRYIRLVSQDCPQGKYNLERMYQEAVDMKERFEEFDLQYQEIHPVERDLPKPVKEILKYKFRPDRILDNLHEFLEQLSDHFDQ